MEGARNSMPRKRKTADESGGAVTTGADDEPELVPAPVVTESAAELLLGENERRLGDLNRFFACTLCGGYLRDAHTITECLHSFCKICLHMHFESSSTINNGFCPSCNVALGPDPMKRAKFNVALQSLFDKLLPQFAKDDGVLRESLSAGASNTAAANGTGAASAASAAATPTSLSTTVRESQAHNGASSSAASSVPSLVARLAAGAAATTISSATTMRPATVSPHALEQITVELVPYVEQQWRLIA